ncbi:MAG: riboflavin synthase [Myxococcaceae bacterium]|jgi:riboflavin synthase|nr:riboflavin synthase [Myxococcaceae bacterium]MCA3014614.1 riboflavin synthase [Myxococcaceae bacterium]
MFTGLVQDVGTVEQLTAGGVTDVWIRSGFDPADFRRGESISCDGVCLTVVEWRGPSFKVQAAPETLGRTTLGRWQAGTRVNLEKALRVGDRLGGHWVQGHVDGVAEVLEVRPDGGSWRLSCSLPGALAPFFVEKGSVCIDGVSLTLTHVSAERFGVMLIPETWAKTSLSTKGVGAPVNLEADIVGKFVAKMVGARGGLTEEQLRLAGFVR